MDPREMDALVQRLVVNPHDQEALAYAHHAGATDPKAYALLLEKVGTATPDPAYASHWLSEAANVWSVTLGDAHRAARVLMIAIDKDPTQETAAERLAQLYRDKGEAKALAALLERRVKALAPMVGQSAEMRAHVAAMHEELGRLWSDAPLSQPKKAIENLRRATELDPTSAYAIYAVRELYKQAQQWVEALPFFEMERALVDDVARKVALYRDEADVRKLAGDRPGGTAALRAARAYDAADPGLVQELGASILERVQGGEAVSAEERREGTEMFVTLAETYDGEHGLAYAAAALDLEPGHDRAMQLAAHWANVLGRSGEIAHRWGAYLAANPQGLLAAEAQQYAGAAPAAPPPAVARPAAPAAAEPVRERVDSSGALDALGAADKIPRLLETAAAAASKGNKTQALAQYREVLSVDPAQAEALSWVEDYLRQKRQYGELRDVLLQATRSPSASRETKVQQLREVAGLCETQLRDLENAIQAWKQIVQLDRGDDNAREQLRRLLERGARWDDLASALEQEAMGAPDVEAKIVLEKKLAHLHEVKRKDVVAAGEAWARIASLTPDDDAAIGTAVKMFEKGQRLDLAAQVIGDNVGQIEDEATRGALWERLAGLRDKLGDQAGAGEAFFEAAELQKSAKLWEAAEKALTQAERWEQAARAIDERAQLVEGKAKGALLAREAGLWLKAGDDAAALEKLEQAVELDPANDEWATEVENRYEANGRFADLASLLLARAEKIDDRAKRVLLRKRAADVQVGQLEDAEAARESLLKVLDDGDDAEALSKLADDAEQRGDFGDAVSLLRRLAALARDAAEKTPIALREARILADGLDDVEGAIARYEAVLADLDPKSRVALDQIALLEDKRGNDKGLAAALERTLDVAADDEDRLALAQRLASLYEGPLDAPKAAAKALEIVHRLDAEDFEATARLETLCEKIEDWKRVAELLGELLEVEGDEEEVSSMARKLAGVLEDRLERGDEALAVLLGPADAGDAPCREAYVELGDRLGWKGIVASKLVEWHLESGPSAARADALQGAFDRFVSVGRDADAAKVAMELARSKGANADIAKQLEEIALKTKDLDALAVAHDLMAKELSGADRATELVRQSEVLVQAGVDPVEAMQHGEQGLTSVPPGQVEPLLARLSALTDAPGHVVDLYERQIARCKLPADRLRALARAAQVASQKGALDRARSFFELALSGGVQEETLQSLEDSATQGDEDKGGTSLRQTLAEALAAGGQGSRDGGRTRSALLRRAATIAHRDLKDVDRAFAWLGDALVTHVEGATLDALEELAGEIGDLKRAEDTLGRALGEVFDGPLVRQLLARRVKLRREKLDDLPGAAQDLKKLHDLSPADQAIMDELSALLTELGDFRGMVQVLEDQILRGKDPHVRAELARKVARLWEEQLHDPREAADAWRRVLRMKSGDPEAQAGLERAKQGMLKKPTPEAAPQKAMSEAPPQKAMSEAPPQKAMSEAPPQKVMSEAPPKPSTPPPAPVAAAEEPSPERGEVTETTDVLDAPMLDAADPLPETPPRPERPDLSFGGGDDEATLMTPAHLRDELLGGAAKPSVPPPAAGLSHSPAEDGPAPDDDEIMAVDEDELLDDEPTNDEE